MAAGAVAGQSGGVDEALASVVSFAAATPSWRTAWHLLDEVLPVCDQRRRGGLLLAGLQRSDERTSRGYHSAVRELTGASVGGA